MQDIIDKAIKALSGITSVVPVITTDTVTGLQSCSIDFGSSEGGFTISEANYTKMYGSLLKSWQHITPSKQLVVLNNSNLQLSLKNATKVMEKQKELEAKASAKIAKANNKKTMDELKELNSVNKERIKNGKPAYPDVATWKAVLAEPTPATEGMEGVAEFIEGTKEAVESIVAPTPEPAKTGKGKGK